MRIRKIANSVGLVGNIFNKKSDSTEDSYSCDYINKTIKDVYSTEEIKTNKVWINGKPIYRKVIDRGNRIATEIFDHNIPNVDDIWINDEFTFRIHATGNHVPLNASGAQTYVYANRTQVTTTNSGAISADQIYITLEYTKTTDKGA